MTGDASRGRLLVRAGPGSREPCGIHASVDGSTRFLVLDAGGTASAGSLALLTIGDTVEIHVAGPVAESCPVQGYAAAVVMVGGAR